MKSEAQEAKAGKMKAYMSLTGPRPSFEDTWQSEKALREVQFLLDNIQGAQDGQWNWLESRSEVASVLLATAISAALENGAFDA